MSQLPAARLSRHEDDDLLDGMRSDSAYEGAFLSPAKRYCIEGESAVARFNDIRDRIKLQRQLKTKLLHENDLLKKYAEQIMMKSSANAPHSKYSYSFEIQLSNEQTRQQVSEFYDSTSRTATYIRVRLYQLKEQLNANLLGFSHGVDGIGQAISSLHDQKQQALRETTLLVYMADEKTQIERMADHVYEIVFPSSDSISQISTLFTPRMREILDDYVGNDDVYVFLQEKIVSYLECTLFELKQNWSRDVERFVKDQSIDHFCIDKDDMQDIRSEEQLLYKAYATDDGDSLAVIWVMMKVLQILDAEQHENLN